MKRTQNIARDIDRTKRQQRDTRHNQNNLTDLFWHKILHSTGTVCAYTNLVDFQWVKKLS